MDSTNKGLSHLGETLIKAFLLAFILVGFTPLGTQLTMPYIAKTLSVTGAWPAVLISTLILGVAFSIIMYLIAMIINAQKAGPSLFDCGRVFPNVQCAHVILFPQTRY